MRMHSWVLGLAATTLLVAACTTSDPNKGGFIGGVGGIVSGDYDAYVARREAIRQEELRKLDAERARADSLEGERSRLLGETSSLRSRISRLRDEGRIASAEASRLSARADTLETSLRGSSEDAARVAALREEVDGLRAAVESYE